jgi:hypothetical protein
VLADDDWLEDGAIPTLAAFLDAHPRAGFVFGDFKSVDRDTERLIDVWRSPRGEFVAEGLSEYVRYVTCSRGCLQATLWRRPTFDAVDGFDDAGNPSDNSLYLKFLKISDVGHVPTVICNYSIRVKEPDDDRRRLRIVQEDLALLKKQGTTWPSAIGHLREATLRKGRRLLARRALWVASDARIPEVRRCAEKLSLQLDESISTRLLRSMVLHGPPSLVLAAHSMKEAVRIGAGRLVAWLRRRKNRTRQQARYDGA